MRDTSIAAAQSIAEGAEQLRARVLIEIRSCNGATCDEVEVALELRHQTASARINELAEAGRVYDSGQRRKTRSGRQAIVWQEQRSLSPILKWAGGKTFLLTQLRQLYATYRDRRLVEPFVGSGAVTFGLLPARALLRDTNPHLVNLHRWLKQGFIIDQVELINDERHYYARRDELNALTVAECFDKKLGAELFYYLNRTCFNGLCRFNKSFGFNVPFGRYSKINYRSDFSEYREPMSGWQIEDGDFESTQLASGDFVYLDPPYDCDFTEYSGTSFTWEQQVRVAEKFAAHDGPIVTSNAATARVINLYHRLGYTVDFVAAPRSVAADASKRGAVLEIFATKNLRQS